MGFSRDELATLVEAVAPRPEVAMIELNVSCPNVETGLVMGADPAETARAVERVRPLTERPLIVKLTPNASEPEAVAAAAQEAGADAVSLINTLKGMALDPRRAAVARRRHRRASRARPCGRSRCSRSTPWPARVTIPVIGMGGIPSGRDALDFLRPGPRRSRSAPRASETRAPAAGSAPSSPLGPRVERACPTPEARVTQTGDSPPAFFRR